MALTLIFDADDTLWENNRTFLRIERDFFAWLAHPDDAHARAVRTEIETANVALHGYGTTVFLRTLQDTVERLRGRPSTAAERAEVDALVAELREHRVELIPGVEDVLTELGTRHELLMLTKGDPPEQQAKIDASGLAGYFAGVHIVTTKVPDTYRSLTAELSLDPATTWMIGNSPRADILAARAAGLNAVYVPNPHTWAHEEAEIDDPAVLQLASLRDLTTHF